MRSKERNTLADSEDKKKFGIESDVNGKKCEELLLTKNP